MNRRSFLGAAANSTLWAQRAWARDQVPDAAFPGMIVREREPVNLEFPFSSLSSWLIPNERFYVRNHFAAPQIDAGAWRLRVEGAVARPLDLTLADLRRMPSVTKPLTLECAGNGRVYLSPKVRGVAWQLGAVGNAEWTGVPLADLLERAGAKSTAVEIVLEGADRGSVNDDPKSPGPIAFARSLPIAKAKRSEVVLAYEMNGRPLPHDHGAPLRAVVGGWYGMASVKWLTRIVAVERPFDGYWQTFDYSVFRRESGLPVMTPITEMQVKASIARPAVGDVVPRNSVQRIVGAAWAGETGVKSVDVSTDGGKTWAAAKLIDREAPMAWRLWEFAWSTPTNGGRTNLMARATDTRGQTQPMERDGDRRTYVINHVVPVEVEVH
jgi:DMSO/TMAO reductase YedYZ molybdopterin-dependent catalytic subunit